MMPDPTPPPTAPPTQEIVGCTAQWSIPPYKYPCCHKNFGGVCPAGCTSSWVGSRECSGDPCTVEDCCHPEPTFGHVGYICPANREPMPGATVCLSASCTDHECCHPPPPPTASPTQPLDPYYITTSGRCYNEVRTREECQVALGAIAPQLGDSFQLGFHTYSLSSTAARCMWNSAAWDSRQGLWWSSSVNNYGWSDCSANRICICRN